MGMGDAAADEEGMGTLERGRRRYQKRDYSGALLAFTEAVNASSGYILLTALDHRAATHEKLQQLQPALLDAKRMIDLKPELSKGYLRCGKILQLKAKPELAFRIYERGLSKVKIGVDDERTILQHMFNKAKRALEPQKVLDPLVFLPLELAQMICEHLTTRDRVICLAVSNPWKRLLELSHKLWTTLDTTYARKPINLRSLKAHLRRSKYTTDVAIITLRAGLDIQKMTYLMSSCKLLRRLEIHGSGVIGDSLTKSLTHSRSIEKLYVSASCQITFSAIEEALKASRNTVADATFLQVRTRGMADFYPSIDFPRFDSLKRLRLKAQNGGIINLDRLANSAPNLESLTLIDFGLIMYLNLSQWTNLQHLEISSVTLSTMPKLPSTLKHLNLSNSRRLGTLDSSDNEPPMLPLLQTFACAGTALDNAVIKATTQESIKRGNLRSLLIGNRMMETSSGPVGDEYPASDMVEELSLAFLSLQEQRLIDIVRLYPNVRRLDVSGTKMTGVAVKAFVHMGVEYLRLNECSEISSDAVEWARGQGVEAEFNFPSRTGNIKAWRDTAFAGFF